MSLPCLRCVPIYQHSREAKNGVVILRLHINQYFRIMEKITFNQLKEIYAKGNDMPMCEILGDTQATGLTIEQAFYMYIHAMNREDNQNAYVLYDRSGSYDLVEEAKNMEL